MAVLSGPPDQRDATAICEETSAMTRMTLRRDDVVVGVDTHKDEHAAVLLDGLGGTLTELVVPATTDGFAQTWCSR
jgi:hypothetical protein